MGYLNFFYVLESSFQFYYWKPHFYKAHFIFELREATTAIQSMLTLFKKHKSLDKTLENKRKELS